MIREYVLDTETTGLDVKNDRITEIAIIELVDKVRTNRVFHTYVNPERLQSKVAASITGLDDKMLAQQKTFAEIAPSLIRFLGKGEYYIVAHNANFDWKFLNMEFKRCGSFHIKKENIIDTLHMAKSLYPNSKNSLDALCTRLNVDATSRTVHGALIDTELLVSVYLKMYFLTNQTSMDKLDDKNIVTQTTSCLKDPNVVLSINDEELKSHHNMLKKLGLK